MESHNVTQVLNRADIFTPIHKAIRSMIYELGKQLQTTDFADQRSTEVAVSRLKEELSAASSACVLCLLHEHAGNEDQYIFPDVRAYEPELVERLLREHGEVVRRIAGVWKIADELKSLKDHDERLEAGVRLNRAANDLFAFYLNHLNGEESTIVPAMWKHFTDEQIIGMQRRIMSATPKLPQWMTWLFPSLNINELTGMFIGLKKGSPPSVLGNLMHIAETSLGKDRWALVKTNAGL